MRKFCDSLTVYRRRQTHEVCVGNVGIGGGNPLRVQSMTNTDTNDVKASVLQVGRIAASGGELVRLTAQGIREAERLGEIRKKLNGQGCCVPLVADIHFFPAAALAAAEQVEKVRINPGNFHDRGESFDKLLAVCRRRKVALRIGVNHGSLAPTILEKHGDTPEGMVVSAMEYLRRCREHNFDQAVVSMKSSNVRVMVHAYRLLVAAMRAEGMSYPLHLGVTEAGNGLEGRVKSAAGIGALLADGLGDTLRVSLTEPPENEIPAARTLSAYIGNRAAHPAIPPVDETLYHPYEYHPRASQAIDGVGGGHPPTLWSELPNETRKHVFAANVHTAGAVPPGKIVVLETANPNGPAEQRAFFLRMTELGKDNPVIIKRSYRESDFETLQIKAAADTGPLFLDGFGDGLWIENEDPQGKITPKEIDTLSLTILQAARVRISRAEFIACPGCGRTLYDLEKTLAAIKACTGHLAGIRIAVMGCIVNGPGEMADADYGYVGAGPGKITLYRGGEMVRRNLPQEQALDELVGLLHADGRWCDPPDRP